MKARSHAENFSHGLEDIQRTIFDWRGLDRGIAVEAITVSLDGN